MSIEDIRIALEQAFDATIDERSDRLSSGEIVVVNGECRSMLNEVLGHVEQAMEWLEPFRTARATEPVEGGTD